MLEYFNNKWSTKSFALIIVMMAAAAVVYYAFFDILIPNIQNDSYRAVLGDMFILPIILLVLGQAGIGGVIVHMFSRAVNPQNSDYMKSTIISCLMTLWFSLTYVIFPKYGPFYAIVFVYGTAPWYALPVEVAWTAAAMLAGTYLNRRILKMPLFMSLAASVTLYTFITLAAS